MSIQHLLYVERDVGGTIKSSKKQFIWEFELDGKPQKIELYDSKWSGKKKIIKNGRVECEVQDQMSFFRSFDLNGHTCTIIQYGEKNELRIDNQSFSHLYNLEKNKTFFNQESGPTCNSMQSKPLPPSKANQFTMNNNFYANTGNADNNKPQLFSFNIKPAEQANQPSKQFQFKSDISSSVSQQKYIEQQQQKDQGSNINQSTGVNLLDLGNDDGNLLNPNSNSNANPLQDQSINANDLFDVFANANQIGGNESNINHYTQKNQGGNDIIDLLGNNNQEQLYDGLGNNNQYNTMNMNINSGIGIGSNNSMNHNQKGDIYSLQENLQSSQLNQQQIYNSNFQPNQFYPHTYNNPNQQQQHNNNGNFTDFFH